MTDRTARPAVGAERRWFDLMVTTRLGLTVGVVVALATLVGVLGITGLRAMGQQNDRLYSDGVRPLGHLADLHNAELKVRMVGATYVRPMSLIYRSKNPMSSQLPPGSRPSEV